MLRIACFTLGALLAAAGITRVSGAQTSGDVPAADSARIVAVLADLDSAWQSGDADRWVAHYAPDARFINVSGMLMADAGTLRDRMAQILHGIFRNSRHTGTLRSLRLLGPDAALAEEEIEIRGFVGLPAGVRATEPGVLRTRMRHVLQRTDGRWLIVASQNTAIAPSR